MPGEITQEESSGTLDEMSVNEQLNLNLLEGDIIWDESYSQGANEKNIQKDLTYRWPEGKIYFKIDTDVEPNVVGVLHQVVGIIISNPPFCMFLSFSVFFLQIFLQIGFFIVSVLIIKYTR